MTYNKEQIRNEKNEKEFINVWTLPIEEKQIFESLDFLVISDKTGEPLFYQTKHRVYFIGKNNDGKYYIKK